MRSDQNPKIKKFGRKEIISEEEKRKISEEKKRKTVERMKNNNPMFNKEVVKKVKETKIKNNKPTKRGPNHKSWKGNRDKTQVIRSRLYKIWILPILERDNFTCQDCGKTKCRLEVHHIKPFREILEDFLNGKILNNFNDNELEKLSIEIEDFHKNGNVEGITYCVDCHKKHDDRRR